MKKYSVLFCLMMFIGILVVFSQTRINQIEKRISQNKLKEKYGLPNAAGQYKVNSEIGLTAVYNKDNNLVELIIAPLINYGDKTSEKKSSKVLPSDMAEDLFNNLIPNTERGKKGEIVETIIGCQFISNTEYEYISTIVVKRCEQQGTGTYSINVRWK